MRLRRCIGCRRFVLVVLAPVETGAGTYCARCMDAGKGGWRRTESTPDGGYRIVVPEVKEASDGDEC